MNRYLIEFRLRGYSKKKAKEIIFDVAKKFRVKGVTRKRAVPHISLFGPFTSRNEKDIVRRLVEVGRKYEIVPFKIKGFGHFNNNRNKVIFLNIEPSKTLDTFRRDLAKALFPLTSGQKFDRSYKFYFHSTIAFKDIDRKFDRIWDYIQQNQFKDIPQNLVRITILKNSRILYEYDLIQRRLLNRFQSKSKKEWIKTIQILKSKVKDDLIDEPDTFLEKLKDYIKWHFL